jgi:hypothetical protein
LKKTRTGQAYLPHNLVNKVFCRVRLTHYFAMMSAGTEARPTFKIKAVGRPSLAARRIQLKGRVRALTGVGKYANIPCPSTRKLDNAALYPHVTDMGA